MREYRLKRWMKILLSEIGLNPDNWHYLKVDKHELVIIYKHTFQTKKIVWKDLRGNYGIPYSL